MYKHFSSVRKRDNKVGKDPTNRYIPDQHIFAAATDTDYTIRELHSRLHHRQIVSTLATPSVF